MKTLFQAARTALVIVVIVGAASAQHRNRTENKALLGVVTEPAKRGVRVMYVLKGSPAAKTKLKAGDVITRIGEVSIKTNAGLDDALAKQSPGSEVRVGYYRGKKRGTANARLVARRAYKGEFLKRRARGTTGFEAPPWFAYAWANTSKRRPAPTGENTKGKIVVFHTFQSW